MWRGYDTACARASDAPYAFAMRAEALVSALHHISACVARTQLDAGSIATPAAGHKSTQG